MNPTGDQKNNTALCIEPALTLQEQMQTLSTDLQATWQATDSMAVAANRSSQSAPEANARLIKKESRTRIIVLPPNSAGQQLCLKLYKLPERLRWRSWLGPARAKREYNNLKIAQNAGLSVVPPVGWAEIKRKGLLSYNALGTLYIPAQSLDKEFAILVPEDPRRNKLIRKAGHLLAEIHKKGLSWMTALPRNIMLDADTDNTLLAFDIPYGYWHSRSIFGKPAAIYDVHMMLWSGFNVKNEMDAHAFLSAYCGGDVVSLAKLEQQLEKSTETARFIYRMYTRSAATLKPVRNV